jgi:hypothetical protein
LSLFCFLFSAENEVKATLARETGITLELLEPKDDRGVYDEPEGGLRVASANGPTDWFKEIDEDLKQEWTEMGARGTDTPNWSTEKLLVETP